MVVVVIVSGLASPVTFPLSRVSFERVRGGDVVDLGANSVRSVRYSSHSVMPSMARRAECMRCPVLWTAMRRSRARVRMTEKGASALHLPFQVADGPALHLEPTLELGNPASSFRPRGRRRLP